MPIGPLVLALRTELCFIDGHGIKVVEHWNVLQIVLELDLRLGLDALVDGSFKIASGTEEVLAIGSQQGFTVRTEHDSHHRGQLFHPMLISFKNLFIKMILPDESWTGQSK